MARTFRWEETRVIVEPKTYRRPTQESLAGEARGILGDVERHVDNVQLAYIDEITIPVCSFCGNSWDRRGGDTEYNGGCCEEDEKNAPGDGD